MNYKPFSLLGRGDIFTTLNYPGIPLMKTGPTTAIWLQGFWSGSVLHPRGEPVTIEEATAIVCPDEPELSLPMANVDPIDPRRKFWQDGDQVKVGRDRKSQDGEVAVFAGLFLYFGFGSGNYYSATGNEIFGGDSQWASERASAEGVPFVYHDSFQHTDDAALAKAQARAREQLDRAAAAVATAA